MAMTPQTMHEVAAACMAWLESKPMVNALLLLMLIDILSGVAVAVVQSNLSSTISWRGMMKKVLTLLVLGVAMVIEPFATGLPIPLANAVAFAFVVTEAISILENASLAGVPIPPGLVNVIAKMNEQGNTKLAVGTAEVTVEVKSTPGESDSHKNDKSKIS